MLSACVSYRKQEGIRSPAGRQISVHTGTEQRQIKLEKYFIDHKDVIDPVPDAVVQHEVEPAAPCQGETGFFQQFFGFPQRKLQRDCKSEHGRFTWPVVRIGTDLAEQLSVYVCLFVTLGVCPAALIDERSNALENPSSVFFRSSSQSGMEQDSLGADNGSGAAP